MKHADIHEGMTLQLKPARQAAYGLGNPLVLVTGIVPRKGYKVPWIESQGAFFAPSDFRREWTRPSELAIARESLSRTREASQRNTDNQTAQDWRAAESRAEARVRTLVASSSRE